MKILNLTQHKATPEQLSAGVVDLSPDFPLSRELTFTTIPTNKELEERAKGLAKLLRACYPHFGMEYMPTHVMIGGAPFFMSCLEVALKEVDFIPVYAFSERVSVEEIQADGSVKKTNVFKHMGFVGL